VENNPCLMLFDWNWSFWGNAVLATAWFSFATAQGEEKAT